MYEDFFGLSGKPFSLLPDADSVFPSKRHRRAMTLLDYGVETQAGFVVISGEVGAGKTTVVRHFLKHVGDNVVVGVITNPSATVGRLLDWVALAFDLKQRGSDDTTLYDAFVGLLLDHYAKGKRTILIVDEAQNLTAAMLEELRMLSNINNEQDVLLQMVLVGQPEMLETLRRPELRQFVQRIAVHCHLDPLTPAETAAYIRYRLSRVGGGAELFDDGACATVHRFSDGVPRLINLLCDQSMVYAFSADERRVSSALIAEVAIDRGSFGLSAFRNVPLSYDEKAHMEAIAPILRQIQVDGKGG